MSKVEIRTDDPFHFHLPSFSWFVAQLVPRSGRGDVQIAPAIAPNSGIFTEATVVHARARLENLKPHTKMGSAPDTAQNAVFFCSLSLSQFLTWC